MTETAATAGPSKIKIGAQYYERLCVWLDTAAHKGELPWGPDGRLIRKEVAKAIGCSASVLTQNRKVQKRIAEFEASNASAEAARQTAARAAGARSPMDKRRDAELLETQQKLRAAEEEIRFLKFKLGEHGVAVDQLTNIGKMPW
jgi:hypothetical protein